MAGLLGLFFLGAWGPPPEAAPGPLPSLQAHDPYVPPRGYVCYRAPGPIRIDGRLDEAAWRAAPWSEEFVDIQGQRRRRPRFRTRVKMLWDDRCLDLGADL